MAGRSLGEIIKLIGKNIAYPFCRLSPKAIKARHQDRNFDLEFGTNTSGTIEFSNLDVPHDVIRKGTRYQASTESMVEKHLAELDLPLEEFTFVDYGSGKGRALLLASHLPFKKVIGAEISQKLHNIACHNIEVYANSKQQCGQILNYCEDVVNFKTPEGPLICYFYNPFNEEILQSVLNNIEQSFQQERRPIWILYQDPIHNDCIAERPQWQVVKQNSQVGKYLLESLTSAS